MASDAEDDPLTLDELKKAAAEAGLVVVVPAEVEIPTMNPMWVYIVLGIPFVMLTLKHGYNESMRNGDLFLFSVTALVGVLFDFLRPARRPYFHGSDIEILFKLGTITWAFVILFANFYLFVVAKGHWPSWVLNVAFWLAVLVAASVQGYLREPGEEQGNRGESRP